jgi:hypothetical protein
MKLENKIKGASKMSKPDKFSSLLFDNVNDSSVVASLLSSTSGCDMSSKIELLGLSPSFTTSEVSEPTSRVYNSNGDT